MRCAARQTAVACCDQEAGPVPKHELSPGSQCLCRLRRNGRLAHGCNLALGCSCRASAAEMQTCLPGSGKVPGVVAL